MFSKEKSKSEAKKKIEHDSQLEKKSFCIQTAPPLFFFIVNSYKKHAIS